MNNYLKIYSFIIMNNMHYSLVLVLGYTAFKLVDGHGMMLDPPNRSSLWRFNNDAPINYNDNQNFCGGFAIQWQQFGGKCGPCGDKFDDPHPQKNENTGTYGRGIIAGNYTSGSKIQVQILLTANHKGLFRYSLCILQSDGPEGNEDCFIPLNFTDGSSSYSVSSTDTTVYNKLLLPENVKCERCVLRWEYTAGNNWGTCGNGTSGLGCGPQETFRTCSDIRIL